MHGYGEEAEFRESRLGNPPDFGRVRKALFCEEPDRVPLMELKIDQEVKDAFMGEAVRTPSQDVQFWAQAGYDYIRMRPDYKFRRRPRTGVSNYNVYTDSPQTRQWEEEGAGVIGTSQEFESYNWLTPEEPDYAMLEEAASALPAGMKIIGSVNGIYENVWMLMGFETFATSLRENPALVKAMFERVGSIIFEIFCRVARMKEVAAMWLGDDIAYTGGLIVSPEVVREHLFPWYRLMGETCRKLDMPFIYHSDGDLREVLDDLVACGVNALHPIEPKAMDILELKRSYGGKLCLIGNIDLSYTLTRGTPSEVEAEVKERIETLGPGGGYCVGSSNTVTNYVPLENFRAMVDATMRYGRYPIGSWRARV